MIKAQTYIKLSAPSDTNGNPRRLYIVHEMNPLNPDAGASRRAIIVENYNGNQEVRSRFPMAVNVTEISISGGEFRKWLNVKKIQEQYEMEEVAGIIQKKVEERGEKITKKALKQLGRLGADFARADNFTIQEGAEMAYNRYQNSPQAFQ